MPIENPSGVWTDICIGCQEAHTGSREYELNHNRVPTLFGILGRLIMSERAVF
jgi:hypothetical protein